MSGAIWAEGPLPAGVELGEGVLLERHEHTFKRFFSRRRPGLVLGPRVAVYTWTTFSIEADAVVEVGEDSVLVGAQFMCGERITIGRRVEISYNCVVADSDFHPHDTELRRQDTIAVSPEGDQARRPPVETRPVVIGDDVRIGMGSMILKGVRLGRGVVVEPGSVVTRSIPAGLRVAGNPARVVQS
jgi:acetyltransferase-like isoleucine patch superfamily enzyme